VKISPPNLKKFHFSTKKNLNFSEKISNFPPIWTKITALKIDLTKLKKDAKSDGFFPSTKVGVAKIFKMDKN